ncbi:primosomal protein DnaI [Companilactobacillus metriopterae]|uniref:primosomal protein DnaI n=1 Tax=Companilactobacillus metriopterae TaxID=1909267 RepID=UPI00100B6E04|nr:primosomal protein DnaI [Companilactobacillus metriopterae]
MEKIGDTIKKLMDTANRNEQFKKLMSDALNDPDVRAFLNEHESELSNESIAKSASSIYEFYNQKHNSSELSDQFVPSLIVNNHNVEVAYSPNAKRIAEENSKDYSSSVRLLDMPDDIKDASLDDYTGEGRQDALDKALQFIENYQSGGQYMPGLYLAGDYGVGKTYLLGAIANELYKSGVKSTLVNFLSLQSQAKGAINDNRVSKLVERLKKSQLLMLDDIGAANMSEWFRDEVLGVILQYRMQENLPVFFSSNFSMNELEEHFANSKNGNYDIVKAKRLMERVRYLSREVIVSGNNRRNKTW